MIAARLLAALALAVPAGAAAQAYSPTGQPDRVVLTGIPYRTTGYRSATFGMDEAQVRAAASRDFGVPPGRPVARVDERSGERRIALSVPGLEPGPGNAQVTYILAPGTGRLRAVEVAWRTAPGAEQALVDASAALVADFLGHSWKLFTTVRGLPAAPGRLIAFAGGDEEGGGVEVQLAGVRYRLQAEQGLVEGPAASGPAILRVLYAQQVAQPDLAQIRRERVPSTGDPK